MKNPQNAFPYEIFGILILQNFILGVHTLHILTLIPVTLIPFETFII